MAENLGRRPEALGRDEPVSPPQAVSACGNPGQLAAISHGSGPLLVLAGPGSGKTFVITRRIVCLIEEKGADPSSILVITFTKAAAGEMRERFVRLTEGKDYPVNFGTFHAVYYHILKSSAHYRSGNIISESEKREILKTILMRPDSPVSGEDGQLEEILAGISLYKNNGCRMDDGSEKGRTAVRWDGMAAAHGGQGHQDGKEALSREFCGMSREDFRKLYASYTEEMDRRGKLDLDDMVLKCHELFLRCPQVLKAWQRRFRFILVDEFQDINPMQYEILGMLALPENNLFVVGDDDQSIYSFRGARPGIMRRFLEDHPDAGKTQLSVNYRSTPEIVRMAGKLIGANRDRLPKQITSGRPGGSPVRFLGFADKREENRALAALFAREAGRGKHMAAIFRTNQDALPLAEELTRQRIPYIMKEKPKSPYRGMVAQDLLAYLSFAMEGRKRKDFYRIMNRPKRYLCRTAAEEEQVEFEALQRFYRDRPYMREILRKFQMDIGRICRMDLFAAVNYVRKGMGYDAYLRTAAVETGKEFQELYQEADWFQGQMRDLPSLEALKEHIRSYEEGLERAARPLARPPEDAFVSLLTMHACKGLEFDLVCIPGCNEGIIPHRKSMDGSQVEEERRMLYVAMTRARQELFLSWIAGTKEEPGFPSRFLSDLGL